MCITKTSSNAHRTFLEIDIDRLLTKLNYNQTAPAKNCHRSEIGGHLEPSIAYLLSSRATPHVQDMRRLRLVE
ncbi:uncharacterized protein PHALS_08885 [Plasmopara halstedii]|uniref:Uncharacterized protein n=1 Tax=Plasmopara halstedii TaxID=4781 RepID=A0A0P1ADM0_PLAHL|nr:uncharacterized protein PHALS_08885 [Plasmopara halstedii]CEG38834.1 hypothetical protein PHALS_08885 [Plasmopara halstedii]|eukprot:XP_024575203.1 hypothetical protein PHALS_08885 [Plasmopara halstedii]